ncbi:MAG: hypothetical protein AB1634_11275 [Thermodesulfobacteriota bacterium]
MRCPKCGYISFDDQAACGRCRHDLTPVLLVLHGTGSLITAPFFLGPLLHPQPPEETMAAEEAYQAEVEPEAMASPVPAEEGIAFTPETAEAEMAGLEIPVAPAPEAEGIAFSLPEEPPTVATEEPVALEIPAAAADEPTLEFPSLEPPEVEPETRAVVPEEPAVAPDRAPALDLELDLDLEEPAGGEELPAAEMPQLSLDSIDLSDLLVPDEGTLDLPGPREAELETLPAAGDLDLTLEADALAAPTPWPPPGGETDLSLDLGPLAPPLSPPPPAEEATTVTSLFGDLDLELDLGSSDEVVPLPETPTKAIPAGSGLTLEKDEP